MDDYEFFKYIRLVLLLGLMMGMTLLAVEVYFVVTNSDRPDFWPDDMDAPEQEMSSGLFSAYVHEDNFDYEKEVYLKLVIDANKIVELEAYYEDELLVKESLNPFANINSFLLSTVFFCTPVVLNAVDFLVGLEFFSVDVFFFFGPLVFSFRLLDFFLALPEEPPILECSFTLLDGELFGVAIDDNVDVEDGMLRLELLVSAST